MPKIKNSLAFTTERLNKIIPPKTEREYYRDSQTTGLVFVVTANNARSFYFSKRIEGRPIRIKIGNYPDTTIDIARRTAHRFLGEVAQGKNPYLALKNRTKTPTLQELFDYWLKAHAKEYKKTWKDDIRVFKKHAKTLHSRRVNLITKRDVVLWHQNIGEQSGKYQANRTLQLVRSIFIVADQLGYTGVNPFAGIRLFPEPPRERFLLPDELAQFYEAIQTELPFWRDLFLISLLTGQRKTNVCKMQWQDIDLDNKLWLVAGEKLKNGKPLAVVLPEPAAEILSERRDEFNRNTTWVFPSMRNKNKPCNPRSAWDRIRKKSGLDDLRMHDLRRTFGSWQAIDGTSLQIIGQSLGHKVQKSTEIYARLITDPVRNAVEKAAQKMLGYCRASKTE